MTTDWDQYNLYRMLEVEPDATVDEIQEAHQRLTSTMDLDGKPDEQKRSAAIASVAANAALDMLSDEGSRNDYDEKMKEMQKAASAKEKIEARRRGKLQEQQSIEEDEKLKDAVLRYETAKTALADLYYERLFKAARNSRLGTVTPEKLLEWLSSERAESMRKAEAKGRRTSFGIDWEGFTSVQDMRKKRAEETVRIVQELAGRFGIP